MAVNMKTFPRYVSQDHSYPNTVCVYTLIQIIIFASHCIFPESNEQGYQWLVLARSYLELDMWSSLRNHTTRTIRMGREELGRFDREARVRYILIEGRV